MNEINKAESAIFASLLPEDLYLELILYCTLAQATRSLHSCKENLKYTSLLNLYLLGAVEIDKFFFLAVTNWVSYNKLTDSLFLIVSLEYFSDNSCLSGHNI